MKYYCLIKRKNCVIITFGKKYEKSVNFILILCTTLLIFTYIFVFQLINVELAHYILVSTLSPSDINSGICYFLNVSTLGEKVTEYTVPHTQYRVRSHAPSIWSHRGTKVVWPDFQPMRVPEEPVCIDFGKIQFLPPCIWNLPFMSAASVHAQPQPLASPSPLIRDKISVLNDTE